jgi:malonyl-CoA/methylmalonyl-CoA synthetase
MHNLNLYTTLAASFPGERDECAIETEHGLYYTWDDIEHGSARIANLLKGAHLKPGERVLAQVDKSVEALLLYLATLRAGGVFVPLNTAYRAAELEYFIGDAAPGLVVCRPEDFSWLSRIAFRRGVRQVFTLGAERSGSLLARAAAQSDRFRDEPTSRDDLAALIYTSGTTGRSKGAMLTHGNLVSNARVLQSYWAWQQNDVLLHTLPMFHVHGLFVACHGALINGSKMIFCTKFDTAQVLALLPRSTVFMGVPTYYTRLLADAKLDRARCSHMRLFIAGSAPLLAETFDEFARRTGHTILERYGMSETLMLCSNPYDGPRVAATVGRPLPGVELRVADASDRAALPGEVGEIQVKGDNVFKGYWQMPEKTASEFTADGFFKTGDLGRWLRPEGASADYVSIVGRSKDLIITGGYNVYPKEIESFIDALPGVAESAVIGIPHADFGEAVVAVVVLRANAKTDEASLIVALRTLIANFKVPKRVHVVDELPRNTMGKVQKALLRERFAVR